MHFSGSMSANLCTTPSGEKPRALAAALRALDLQVCLHTTLLPYKKPVSTCVNTGLTCMLCGASSPRPFVQLGANSSFERGSIRHPRNVLAADNVERLVALSK